MRHELVMLSDELTRAADVERNWFFTFGVGSRNAGKFVVLHGTEASCRTQMLDRFGREWAFQYDSAEAAGVYRYHLGELEES